MRESCAALYCGQSNPENCPKVTGASIQDQQAAGIAALIGIATQVYMVMSEAPTANIPSVPGPVTGDASSRHIRDLMTSQTETRSGWSRLRKLQARLQTDHLVRNSLYLMLSAGLQAALGFTFWVITARLFSTEDVGRASSLVTATSLLAVLSLFGLNTTLVRFPAHFQKPRCADHCRSYPRRGVWRRVRPDLPPTHSRYRASSGVCRAPTSDGSRLCPADFRRCRQRPDRLRLLIASRKASYCALTDGVVSGITKIASALILVGAGAYGLYCASAAGFATAAVVSLVLIATALRWRPSLTTPFRTLKPLLRFSSANYAGNICMLLPTLVVPLIVLDRLGASAAAYYFVAFQIATLLYSAVYAVEQAFLAEGSHADADWREIRKRSRRFAFALFAPACLVLIVAAHWVMLTFGGKFSHYGTPSLMVLALAVIPIAAFQWSWTVLRITGQLQPLIASAGVYALAICGLAWFLAPHGLTAVAASWPVGCSLAAIVASVAVAVTPRTAPRHRRTTRAAPTSPSTGRYDAISRRLAEPR